MGTRKKARGNKNKGVVAYVVVRGGEYIAGFSYPPDSDRKVHLVQSNRSLEEGEGFFDPSDGTLLQESAPISMGKSKIGSDCYVIWDRERRLAYEWIGETGESSAEWISSQILESFVVDGIPYRDMMAMTLGK